MGFRTIAILLCVSILSIEPLQIGARTRTSTASRQQVLVKRINQGALRFYRTFIRQSIRTTAGVDCELNDLLEDLLLAADGLTNPRYTRHNLVIVMEIASDIEQELLAVDVSPDVIIAWSRLHADLDRLAKMNGIEWSESVITDQWIAALAGDVEPLSLSVLTGGRVGRVRLL